MGRTSGLRVLVTSPQWGCNRAAGGVSRSACVVEVRRKRLFGCGGEGSKRGHAGPGLLAFAAVVRTPVGFAPVAVWVDAIARPACCTGAQTRPGRARMAAPELWRLSVWMTSGTSNAPSRRMKKVRAAAVSRWRSSSVRRGADLMFHCHSVS